MAKYWTTQDGRQIYLKDMTVSHLKNAINFLHRRQNVFNGFLESVTSINYLQKELDSRNVEEKDYQND